MINGEKIGCGIITCNRPELLKKLYDSITTLSLHNVIDEIVIINDGEKINDAFEYVEVINNSKNLGVAKSKNKAFRHLLDQKCDHIFIIEDDMYIKDPKVFEKYIETSKVTGIQHFNYSQHGVGNKKWPENSLSWSVPNPRVVIDYGSVKLPLYPHCVGAFSYYSKKCLENVGLIDERYYNACEHVDHTFEIIKAGMHPPYWFFADIENSWEYLGDKEWSIEQSSILSNPNARDNIQKSDKIFLEKHGHLPTQTPLVDMKEVGKSLKEIGKQYGQK